MKHATNAELQVEIARLAKWTWNQQEYCHRRNLSFSEETITETLLYKLSKKFSNRGLEIKTFTKKEEGTTYEDLGPTGADWEFWIENKNGGGIKLRIQAKRLFFLNSGKYDSFDARGQQLKDLQSSAIAASAIPLYIFYNEPLPKAFLNHYLFCTRHCCGSLCLAKSRIEYWGCAVASPSAIKVKNKPEPTDVSHVWPWHCLFCPRNSSHAKLSLPMLLLEALRQMEIGGKLELSKNAPAWVEKLKSGEIYDLGPVDKFFHPQTN
jgi:hypothetical protein